MQTIVLPFTVQTLSGIANGSEITQKTWRHQSRQILWFTNANGEYTVDSKVYSLRKGDLYFPPPGVIQRLCVEPGLAGYIFSFRSDVLGGAVEAGFRAVIAQLVYRCVHLRLQDEPVSDSEFLLQQLADSMARECENPHATSPNLLNSLFTTFMLCLQRIACQKDESSPTTNPPVFRQFYDKLEQRFSKQRTVSGYAAELAISARQLSDVVRRVTGISASKFISQRAAIEAKRLALYTDHNMKYISYQLGFADQAHFSRFFKRSTGMSFTDFKKNKDIVSPGARATIGVLYE